MDNQNSRPFVLAPDGVDPNTVPYKTLYTGAKMPVVGLGTFGSDRYNGEAIAQALKESISVGYRHLDCAAAYGNESLIGQSLRDVQAQGVKREDLWISSKLWNDMHDA